MAKHQHVLQSVECITRAPERASTAAVTDALLATQASLVELLIESGVPADLATATAMVTISKGLERHVMRTLLSTRRRRVAPRPTPTKRIETLPSSILERVGSFLTTAPMPSVLRERNSKRASTLCVLLGHVKHARPTSPLVATLECIARGSGTAAIRAKTARTSPRLQRAPPPRLQCAPPPRLPCGAGAA